MTQRSILRLMTEENATITRIPGMRVGHATDAENVTGCTVVLVPPAGARCVVDVRGGAPGTRETAVLAEGSATPVHAILLAGGSAFGLAAADGVMRWLAERNIGFATPARPVPIVPAAILYDLMSGRAVPPTAAMGYAAADAATAAPVPSGSVGAGTGASVGKWSGREYAMPGGIGSAVAIETFGAETFAVGALFAVNAVGDIWDVEANRIVAGAHDAGGWRARQAKQRDDTPPPGTNTTIGVVATDAPVPRTTLIRMAISAHDGLARAIRPAHTAADGDTIFVLTTATDEAALPPDTMLPLSITVERVVSAAILDAVTSATARVGLPSVRDEHT